MSETQQSFERAAPPDDGGSLGSYTKPDDMLFERPQDTRSQEMTADKRPQQERPNRDLWMLMLAIVALALVMFAVGVYKHGI